MRCKCGFENAADARFCGNCRSALGDVSGSTVPNAVVSSTAPPVATGTGRAPTRPLPRATIAIIAVVVVVAAAGYWWMNRPPGRYRPDNGGLYGINVNGKYGFMDRSGKTVITPQFDGVIGFSEGLASVRVGTKWGYINTKGVVAITPQFDFAMPFRYGRAKVQLANRYGYIDKEGKYIGSPTFLWASEFSGEFAAVQTADRALALVNQSGKTVLLTNVDTLAYAFNTGLLPAASGGKWGFMDTTGKWVIDPQFEGVAGFADGRAPVKVGGRIGYVDLAGKFVINPQYDQGNEFNEGYASFANGGKWGFIDTGGKEVCAPKFLAVGNFSDGLAPTQTEDGWGFIDKTCKLVVSPQFDGAESFQNGLAHVTALGKEGYVTTAGSFVVNPFPGTTVLAEKARRAAEAADAAAKANAEAAAAAAKANAEAAETAAKAAQEAAVANAAKRSRVEQGIAGEWAGRFNNDPRGRLAITRSGGAIGATIQSSGWREVFNCELLQDGTLVLTGTGATRVGPSSSSTYSLDTLRLELDANRVNFHGQYRDAQGHTGPVVFAKCPGWACLR